MEGCRRVVKSVGYSQVQGIEIAALSLASCVGTGKLPAFFKLQHLPCKMEIIVQGIVISME